MHSFGRYGALFLFVASSAFSPAATIRSLSMNGNTVFSTREISAWLVSRPGTSFVRTSLESDCRGIVDNYRAQGYLAASVLIAPPMYGPDSTVVDLSLRIDEGRQTLVGRISLSGNSRLTSTEILERFDVMPGTPLRESLLERDIEALLARYERLGHPFVRCDVETAELRAGESADSVDIALRLDEGRRMTIDEIRVEGNKETDAAVVVRETRLEPGEPYSPTKIDAIRQRLNRLNIFSSVGEPELYVRGERGGLRIRVQEGATNTFDGVLGYIPSSVPGESGYLTGVASVAMRNLFGTGRKLSLRWQREDRYSQEIGLRYIEPWIFGAPVNVGGGFFQRQQDSTYVRRTIDLKGEVMLSEDFSISLVFNGDRVIPSGDSVALRTAGSTSTTVGVEIQYDTRDDLYSPTSGARYRTDYHYGRISGTDPAVAGAASRARSGTLQRLGIDLDFYLPTFRRQVAAIGLHGREIRTGQIQESDMVRFGGANTLRGYRENQFLGSRIVWTNAEYRLLLTRRSFLYGFIDTGYYFRPADETRGLPGVEAFRSGYGIGVRVETPLGNIGVSFALGQGDSFGTAKIHVGLINEF